MPRAADNLTIGSGGAQKSKETLKANRKSKRKTLESIMQMQRASMGIKSSKKDKKKKSGS